MEKIIVIVTKNGVKYQIGMSKSVTQVLNEICACKNDFFQIHENCAIRKDEIVSVESFTYKIKQEDVEE